MKCPKCQTVELKAERLDGFLPVQHCSDCGGNWLMLEDYLLHKHEVPVASPSLANAALEAEETEKALLCPMTGALMTKFRISKDTAHRLDLSARVNGIWLDKGEWELLKAHGLAGRLNTLFTDFWQRQVREAQADDRLDEMYRSLLGEDDYEKLKELRNWLKQHPQRERMRAFLLAEGPASSLNS